MENATPWIDPRIELFSSKNRRRLPAKFGGPPDGGLRDKLFFGAGVGRRYFLATMSLSICLMRV
jgi:hypothetical protein